MNVTEALDRDMLRTVTATCVKCWREAHPVSLDGIPAEAGIQFLDDYKRNIRFALERQDVALQFAWDCGWEGDLNDLQYIAHREDYARSGNTADLAAMLRHVAP